MNWKLVFWRVNEKMANLVGFVLFDETNRYEIDLPKGW
jgi:hypothetical protein